MNARPHRRFRTLNVGILAAILLAAVPIFWTVGSAQRGGAASGLAQDTPSEPLHFQYMGPPSSGRISAVAGIPGDTTTYYAGAASGGVWKSTDSGRTFVPIFDDQPVQAIGALAVASSDPKIVWAGTGEAWAIRDADVQGDGVYKSTDAGATWKNMGLKDTGRISRIIVHPKNPDIVFVAALGRSTGPQEERGVYRTTDGGATWQRVLFVDPNTGVSGLAMDAVNPDILIAGTWEVVLHTWAMFSGGPGSGIHISKDGGTTWKKIVHPGLPKSPVGKIDVAIAPSNSARMFALIQTPNQGSLWRSDDAGVSWKVVSWDRSLIGRAGYYIRIAVHPTNPDEVLVMNSSSHRSTDGGLTFPLAAGGCGDCHDVWMDPKNPDHWVTTGDGGMGITTNHAQSFFNVTLPIGQMYHLAIDNRVPYWIYSNRQDDGTMRGPSNSPVPVTNVPTPTYTTARPATTGGRGGGGGGEGEGGGGRGGPAPTAWQANIGGCESGFTIPDLSNPDIIWATCYGNKVTRFDNRLGQARSVSPWIMTLDSEPNKVKYRAHWTPPLALDPFDQKTVYYGTQVIHKTSNGGQSWTVISPDLSTNDPTRIVSSGGIIGDNLGQFYGEVVFAIAPSKIQRGLIWAGTNDGLIWLTTNGGGNWTNVTKNVAGLPVWGTVRQISPSSFDAGTAYVAVDFHMMDTRGPFIYKTTDFGQSWKKITGDIPASHPLDYVMTVVENPNRKGMLFAGTGHGFYYSMDDGGHWVQFKGGLPASPVTWIEVAPREHDVVVSTYGRGLWLLRDITTLEQADQVRADAPAFLYAPRPGVRQARSGRAEFLYTLKAAGPVTLEIVDESGSVIRTVNASGRAGMNRGTWDLRREPSQQVALRTTPPDNPHIWDEPRFKGRTTRPIVHWGIQGPQRTGPIAAPGKFTVRLTAGGAPLTRPFEIVKDPAIPSSDADLQANTAMQIRIQKAINETAEMINRLEIVRRQLEDQLKANAGKAALEKALRDFDRKALDVELRLLSRSDLHSDDKWYVEAYKVYLNLLWFFGDVGLGASDVAGGAEYRPTDQAVQILDMLEKELADARTAFNTLMNTDVPAFNKAMAGKVPAVTDTVK